MPLPRPLLSGLLATAVLVPAAPVLAAAAPTAAAPSVAPPAYSLHPVSGGIPGEDGIGAVHDLTPDGRFVLYSAWFDDPSESPAYYSRQALVVRDRDSGTSRIVDHVAGTPQVPVARFSADTAALSADGGTVVWVGDDDGSLEEAEPRVTGEAFVADAAGLRRLPRSTDAAAVQALSVDLSADGRRAAVLLGDTWSDEPSLRLEVVDVDAGRVVSSTPLDAAAARELTISADGSTVSWLDEVEGPPDEWGDPTWDTRVVVAPTDDPAAQRVFADAGDDDQASPPSLSADGARLAYNGPQGPADEHGDAPDSVRVVDLGSGAAPRELPVAGTTAHRVRLSGDGATVTYDDVPYDLGEGYCCDSHVWSVAVAGGAPVRVAGRLEQDDPDAGSPLGDQAYGAVPSHDGSTVALLVDGTVMAAVRNAGDADTTAPTWPSGAALTAEPAAADTVRLTWPAASDDRQVARYEITADDRPAVTVPGGTTTYEHAVPAADRDRELPFTVRAYDTSGNASAVLAATGRVSAGLTVARPAWDTLDVSWPAAGLDGVVGYRVSRAAGGQAAGGSVGVHSPWAVVADLAPEARELTQPGLAPLTWYDFKVDLLLDGGGTRPWATRTSGRTDLPVLAAPVVSEPRADGVRVSWEPLPDGTPLQHVRVERQQRSPDRELTWTPSGTVARGEPPVVEVSGLAPRTTWAWRVVAVLDHDWPERVGAESSGSTSSEGISGWTVTAPRTADGAAVVLGADVEVTVTGEPGATGTLRVWERSDATGGTGEPAVVLPMSESAPGRYTATLTADGTPPRLGWIEAELTAGDRRYVRGGTVGPVSGRLSVTASGAEDPLPGLELVLTGPKGSQRQPFTAPGSAHVPVSPGTWTVQLVTADGDVVAERRDVVVLAAGLGDVELAPVRHAALTVAVSPPAGTTAPARRVVVGDLAGDVLATAVVRAGTTEVVVPGLPARTDVSVRAELLDRTLRVSEPTGTTSLVVGPQRLDLQAQVLPPAAVTTTVRAGGAPLAGALVAVLQRIDGRDWRTTATTDAHGVASMTALAGPAQVQATASRHLPGGTTAELGDGAPTPVTVDLVRAPDHVVRPVITTQNAGADPVQQPMDWATNVHLRATLTVGGRPAVLTAASPVVGEPGEQVRLCANGIERQLDAGCVTTTLGADPDVRLELALRQAGGLRAHLVDVDGTDATGWWASLYSVRPDGRISGVTTLTGTGADVRLGVPTAGAWQVVLSARGGTAAPRTFSVVDGQVVDLGQVRVTQPSGAQVGAVLQALPTTVVPGDRLTFRVALPNGVWKDRTTLVVTTPAGATPEPAGVTVDGAPVTAVATAQGLEIPVTGSAAQVVRYSVVVDEQATAGRLESFVRLVHASGGATAEVGVVAADVAGVTLAGPRTTSRTALRMSGTAPAGAAVVVRQGEQELGRGTAGAGGRWSADVELPLAQRGSLHALRATATSGGRPLTSADWLVRYDDSRVEPTRVVIGNAGVRTGDREIAFDPRAGVAEFTMVFVPNQPVTVRAEFEDASRVEDFVAHVGAVSAPGTCTDRVCTAVVQATSSAQVGDVWLDYETTTAPLAELADLDVPTLDELRQSLPPLFSDPRDLVEAVETGGWKGTVRMGATGAFVEAEVRGSTRTAYEPTAGDLRLLSRTGVPAYGISVDADEVGDDLRIHFRMSVPQSFLSGTTGVAALSGVSQAVTVLDAFFTVKQWTGIGIDQIKTLLGTGDEEYALGDLEAHVREEIEPCAPEIAKQMYSQLDYSRLTVQYYRFTNNAFGLLGLASAGWAKGLFAEAAALGAETALGELTEIGINRMIADEMDGITAYVMRKEARCDKKLRDWPRDDKKPPVARPSWIYDPSGFVYEALGEHRLAGVTATVEQRVGDHWVQWDAAAFGQTNPQVTGEDGRYGWDVPKGLWRVRYDKAGYRSAFSPELEVLPEHYDVDVDLHRLAPPVLTGVGVLETGSLEVVFDEWMDVASVVAGTSVSSAAGAVSGRWEPVEPAFSPRGTQLARSFRFEPAAPFASGQVLRLAVAADVVDHGGVALGAAQTRTVTAPTRPGGETPACTPLSVRLTPPQSKVGHTVKVRVTGPAGTDVRLVAAVAGGAPEGLAQQRTDDEGRTTFSMLVEGRTRVHVEGVTCTGSSDPVVLEVK